MTREIGREQTRLKLNEISATKIKIVAFFTFGKLKKNPHN